VNHDRRNTPMAEGACLSMQTGSRRYFADEILIARIKLNEVWPNALAGVKKILHIRKSRFLHIHFSHLPQPITIAKFVTLLDM
jgi:hypothetical protein